MDKPLSLRKNFLWTLAGNIVASGCQWAILIVIAKSLSATEVGYYVLGLAISAPVVLFSMLQLRAVLVTDVKNLNKFQDFFGVRLITNVIATLVIVGILISLMGRYEFRVYVIILLITLNKVIEATSDIAYGLVQKHERLDKVAQSLILRNIGALVFFAVIVKFTSHLVFAVCSISMWWLLVLFFWDKRNVEEFDSFLPHFNIRTILSLIWLGLPLGVVMGFMSANSNMARYFVEAYWGSEDLGYYGSMAYVVVAASRVTVALGQSAIPRLARYHAFNQRAYVILLGKILMVALALGVLAVLFAKYFGRSFLLLAYTSAYAKKQDVFVWLMVAAAVTMLASMLGYGVTAARRFKSQIPVFCVTCGICFLSNWVLVPRYGMKGAAWSTLLTMSVQGLGLLVIIIWSIRTPKVNVSEEVRI